MESDDELQALQSELTAKIDRINERLDKLEKDTHLKELESKVEAANGTQRGLLERVELLEDLSEEQSKFEKNLEESQKKLRDELLDKLKADNATLTSKYALLEEKCASLESLLGDSTEKHNRHVKEIESANSKLRDFQGALSGERTQRDKRITELEEQLSDLERKFSSSTESSTKSMEVMQRKLQGCIDELQVKIKGEKDSRDAHHSTIAERLDTLEQFVGDSSVRHDKHAKELEAAHSKLRDLQGTTAGERTARERHLTSVSDRLEALEKLVDTCDEQSNSLQALEAAQKKVRTTVDDLQARLKTQKESSEAAEASLNERLEYIETFVGDSQEKHDKHLRDMENAHSRLKEMQSNFSGEKLAREQHAASLEERVEFLEREVKEKVDNQGKLLETLEAAQKKHKSSFDDLSGRVKAEKDTRDLQQNTVSDRLDYLEQFVNESGDKHDRHAKELESAGSKLKDLHSMISKERTAREQHVITMEERLESLERQIGDTHEKHAKACEALELSHKRLKAGLDDMYGSVRSEKDARETHHTTIYERIEYLEERLGESAAQHEKHVRELEAANAKLKDTHSGVMGEKAIREQHLATVEERLEFIEKQIGDAADNHAKLLSTMETNHKKLNGTLDDMNLRSQSEKSLRDTNHSTIEERLAYLERTVGEAADQHSKALDDARAKIMDAHSKLDSAKGDHTDHRTTMEERLEYLERLIGDNADKHSRELEAARSKLADMQAKDQAARKDHQSTIEERLEFIEKQIGETDDRHSKALSALETNHQKLRGNLDDLHGRVKDESGTRDNHHATIAERLEYIEKELGDSADKHAKHLKEMDAASAKIRDLEGTLSKAAGNHKEAMDALHSHLQGEKDNREASHSTVETRLGYLEKLIGDSADKFLIHTQAFDAAHSRLQDLEGSLASAMKGHSETLEDLQKRIQGDKDSTGNHIASISERINHLEAFCGESGDKHENHLQALEIANNQLRDFHENFSGEKAHRERFSASVEQRLEFIEKQIGDAAEFNMSPSSSQVFDLPMPTSGGLKGNSSNATLNERLQFIETFVGESADKHDKQLQDLTVERSKRERSVCTLEERLENLERQASESKDTHSRDFSELQQRLASGMDDLNGQVRCTQEIHAEHRATMDERLQYLEKYVGDSAEKIEEHARAMQTTSSKLTDVHGAMASHKEAHDGRHASIEERLEAMERQLGDVSDDHTRALESMEAGYRKLRGTVDDLHGHVKGEQENRDQNHATVVDRLEYLERFIGESADKHQKHMKDIEAAHGKLKDIHGVIAGEKSAREERVSTMEERLESLERQLTFSDENHTKAIQAMEANNRRLRGNIDEMHGHIKTEQERREEHHATVADRLEFLEQFVGESAEKHEKHAKDLEAAHAKMRELSGKSQSEKASFEERHGSLEERIEALERFIGDAADKHADISSELADLRERLGDTKNIARAEHIRSIHQVLATEKSAREASEAAIEKALNGERVLRDNFEASIDRQLKLEKEAREAHHAHMCEQIEQEQKARELHNESFKKIIAHERGAREQGHQTILEALESERSTREQQSLHFQDRGDAGKTDALYERVESLERTVGFFDEICRKERDERLKDNKRIWDAIDSHTHDLSTTVVRADGELDDERYEVPRQLALPAPPAAIQHSLPTMEAEPVSSCVVRQVPPIQTVQTVQVPVTTVQAAMPQQYSGYAPTVSSATMASRPPVAMRSVSSFAVGSPVAPMPSSQVVSSRSLLPVTRAKPVPPMATMRSNTEVLSRSFIEKATPREPRHEPRQEQREHIVETITCGHTRYGGERHTSAQVTLD